MVFRVGMEQADIFFTTGAFYFYWKYRENKDTTNKENKDITCRIKEAALVGIWGVVCSKVTLELMCYFTSRNSDAAYFELNPIMIVLGACIGCIDVIWRREKEAIALWAALAGISHILPKNRIVRPCGATDFQAIAMCVSMVLGEAWNYANLPQISMSQRSAILLNGIVVSLMLNDRYPRQILNC
jgi:hypothetical protein